MEENTALKSSTEHVAKSKSQSAMSTDGFQYSPRWFSLMHLKIGGDASSSGSFEPSLVGRHVSSVDC